MNEAQFNGTWDNLKGEVKKHWAALSDDDVKRINGHKDKLLASIEKKYGYAKEKAENELNDFLDRMEGISSHNSVSDAIRHVGDGVKDYSYKIANKSERLNAKAHDTFDANYDQVASYIKKHPVQTAAIGVGLGVLIAKLLK